MIDKAREVLKKVFGYNDFRLNQQVVIERLLENENVLVLMPTGGGKSICYQIPALISEGTAVVISPLISLMKDQVEALQSNGVNADFLNSAQNEDEQKLVEERLMNGEIKLLYVSPEKFNSDIFTSMISSVKLSLIAVDEAHCISSWGHDFRPEYQLIGKIKSKFKDVPTIALTATADKITRKDIQNQLNIPAANAFVSSFDRPNLSLNVLPGKNRMDKILSLLQSRKEESGIIYCTSRKSCESIANKLCLAGYNAKPYHAGLKSEFRSATQSEFIKDELPIVVATIAFGMGIDKSNVRWVIHYNLPKNIESYYQEIGRAGRDGVKSDTFLFSTYADVLRIKEFIKSGGQQEFQEAKLQRLLDYTEARICRRKVLLAYFGEVLPDNCGNCDVCRNPPKFIDGTVIAQKALSAVMRLNQKESLITVIEVLKGSSKPEIYQKGYHLIKTFGAGKELPFGDWQQYLLQLLNLGYIDVAYDDNHTIKVTPEGKKVLFDKAKVELVKLSKKDQLNTQTSSKKPNTAFMKIDEELFSILRKVRIDLAKSQKKAPYMIFSDATLNELCKVKPTKIDDLIMIEGIGNYKKEHYGEAFVDAIKSYVGN